MAGQGPDAAAAGGDWPDAGPTVGNGSAEPPGSPTLPEQGCAWSPCPEGGEEPLRLPTFSPAAQARVAVTFALFALSAGCNLAVLRAAGGRRGARRSHIRLLLRHLAAADLLVTVAVMPLDAVWNITLQWRAGDLACRLLMYLRLLAMYASAFVTVVISLDRQAAILHPLAIARARRRNRAMLRAAWLLSAALSLPQLFLFHTVTLQPPHNFTQCTTRGSFPQRWHETLYNMLSFTCLFLLPLLIMVCCYARILLEISRRMGSGLCEWGLAGGWQGEVSSIPEVKPRPGLSGALQGLSVQVPGPGQAAEPPAQGSPCCVSVSSRDVPLRCSGNNIPRARLRMLKMSLVIVSSFILCWTPYYLLGLWYWFCPRAMQKRVSPSLTHILFIFGLFNACLDPITYGLFTIPFRRGCGCPCGHSPEPEPPSPATGSFRCSASSLRARRGAGAARGQQVPTGPGLPAGAGSCQSSAL
ncbi:gonadotropin-releasing hormone receptor-like isoform X1 [Oxyura jamaicensis]|uniref:gonadotropin-releasing hormone receptor-like isoform X1 n=1 Tax=Oxyura jamaicensis TaxID=8884 RepID=UPI0015A6B946|nr:gonadotropin-releasing hormone receptor-like isoform X1 [Oxyura jamaicensis]